MRTHRLYFPNGFEKTKERGAFFIFLSEYTRTFKRAIDPACIQPGIEKIHIA